MTRGQARGGAAASAHTVACAGSRDRWKRSVAKALAVASSAEPSPSTAAFRSRASCGHVDGDARWRPLIAVTASSTVSRPPRVAPGSRASSSPALPVAVRSPASAHRLGPALPHSRRNSANTRPSSARLPASQAVGPARVGDRVDDAVEHHRAHAAGEQVRVGLADHRAARSRRDGEPALAEEPAQAVEVARRVRGRDVREQRAGTLAAAPRECLGPREVAERVGRGRGHRPALPEARPRGGAAEAAHGGAAERPSPRRRSGRGPWRRGPSRPPAPRRPPTRPGRPARRRASRSAPPGGRPGGGSPPGGSSARRGAPSPAGPARGRSPAAAPQAFQPMPPAAAGSAAVPTTRAASRPATRPRPTIDDETPAGGRGSGEVELGGLEPPTSWVRSRRSPN